jgi:hypothetical protein
MTDQLALTLADEGKRLSVEPLSDTTRREFQRILGDFIAAGEPFSADDLRWALDLADIPTTARGGLISGALARRLIREDGVVRSTHPNTHGKRIGVYVGCAEAA